MRNNSIFAESDVSSDLNLAEYQLSDFIDIKQIKKLFELQFKFSGLPVGLIDLEGNVLVGVGWQEICMNYHRANPKTELYCRESELQLNNILGKNRYAGYKCKMGLWDYVIPVKVAGYHMANLFFGQFFFENDKENLDYFSRQAKKYGYDKTGYLESLKKVPRLSEKKVEEIMEYYTQLVDMITNQAYKNILHLQVDENRNFLQSIYEGADMPIFVVNVDRNNRFTYEGLNNAHQKSTGLKNQEIVGKSPKEIPGISVEAAKEIAMNYQRCVEEGNPVQYKESIVINGIETHWLTTLTPLKNPRGKVFRIVGTSMSINELVATERELTHNKNLLEKKVKERTKKLKSSEEKNRSIFEAATDSFLIVDYEGNIAEVNPATCKLYGYSHDELLSMNVSQLIHPDYHHIFTDFIKNISEKGSFSGETTDIRKDGSTFETEVHGAAIHFNNQPHLLAVIRNMSKQKEAERKLLAEMQLNDAVINAMPGVFYLFNREGKYLKWNNAVENLSGFTPEKIKENTPLAFIVPNHWEKVTDAIKKTFETGHSLVEADFQTKSGAVPYLFTGVRIEQNGEPLILGVGIDISKRVKAEKMRENALSDLNERMKEITCLYEINELFRNNIGNLTEMLQVAADLIPRGWFIPDSTSAEIQVDDMVVRSANFVHSAHFLQENIVIDEVVRGYVKVTRVNFDAGKNKDPFLPEEKTLLRQIALNIASYVDKMEYEQALQESEEKFRNIIKSSPLPKVLLSMDNKVQYANDIFIEKIGYTPEEVPDLETWLTFAFPDPQYREQIRQQWSAAMEEVLLKERPSHPVEATFRCKDGVSRTFSVIGNKIDNRLLIIFNDLTERIQAEQKLKLLLKDLKRSNEELEQFAYVASHDLQEPLRMVSSYTQMLERRYKDQLDERAEKYIYYAVDGAKRMQNLINDLLSFSRISTRGDEFVLTDFNSIITSVLKSLEMVITETGTKIYFDELPVIKADKAQIERLFQNLIGNAVKFKKPGEKAVIHISAKEKNGNWLFAVKDNGIGIDAAYKEKIFVIFQKLHGPNEYPGTGIGLAICKRIVNRHGGKLWFESEPGNGTTFFFTINSAH